MNDPVTSIDAIARPVPVTPEFHAASHGDIAIFCHAGPIPPWIDAEMRRLYGNIHSTLAHLSIYGGLQEASHTYVACRNNRVIAAFLFRHKGDAVQVINEGMAIDEADIERFAAYVFATWPKVATILFHAVQADFVRLAFPYQHYTCTANIVLPLPDSKQTYLAGLGKNMRRNLRRYMDKLKRDHPSFHFSLHERELVQERHVRDIIALNRARIAGKNRDYAMEAEEDKVLALAKATGLVGVVTIDGQVAAGAVGYLVGDNYFFKVIAHDPKYNEYSAGILCCYLMICACIERGCKEYNFMWNEYEYKFALGAHSRGLKHVAVYRSRWQLLMKPRLAAGIVIDRYRHQLTAMLDKADKPEQASRGARAAIALVSGMRRLKRSLGRQ